MDEKNNGKWDHWIRLKLFIKERFSTPIGHPPFIFYFIFAIVIVGSAGIWIELLRHPSPEKTRNVLTAIATYIMAVAATSAFELILPNDNPASVKAASLSLSVILCLIVGTCMRYGDGLGIIVLAILGYILTLAMWWAANGDNKDLQSPPPNPTASMGYPDPNKAPDGSTKTFKT